MNSRVLQLNPRDNVLVALQNLHQGELLHFGFDSYLLASAVPAKHKFAIRDLAPGDPVVMYGVLVGKTVEAVPKGHALTTRNLRHDSAAFQE